MAMEEDRNFLTSGQVLEKIRMSLEGSHPFSLVRIGDGENIVLAQDSVWTIEKVLSQPWAQRAMEGKKGIDLPNLELRDRMIEAIGKADLVGIHKKNDQAIIAPEWHKRPLTDEIFAYYGVKPKAICDALIMRNLAAKKDYWDLFKRRKVLLIYHDAANLKKAMEELYQLNISYIINFNHYNQLSQTLKEITENRNLFDVALISCGVTAVVLAPKIAELGKIGIDFGKGSQAIIQKAIVKIN